MHVFSGSRHWNMSRPHADTNSGPTVVAAHAAGSSSLPSLQSGVSAPSHTNSWPMHSPSAQLHFPASSHNGLGGPTVPAASVLSAVVPGSGASVEVDVVDSSVAPPPSVTSAGLPAALVAAAAVAAAVDAAAAPVLTAEDSTMTLSGLGESAATVVAAAEVKVAPGRLRQSMPSTCGGGSCAAAASGSGGEASAREARQRGGRAGRH